MMKKLVKLRELSRSSLVIGFVVFCSLFASGQNTPTQFFGGVSIKNPGFTLQANRPLGKRFKVSGNFHFYRIRGTDSYINNGVLAFSYTYDINFKLISALIEYYLFKTNGRTFHGVALGLGPGYADITRNTYDYLNGFGLAIKLEYQVNVYKGLYAGAEMFGLYFKNMNEDHATGQGKLAEMPIILKIGFSPGKSKKRK